MSNNIVAVAQDERQNAISQKVNLDRERERMNQEKPAFKYSVDPENQKPTVGTRSVKELKQMFSKKNGGKRRRTARHIKRRRRTRASKRRL